MVNLSGFLVWEVRLSIENPKVQMSGVWIKPWQLGDLKSDGKYYCTCTCRWYGISSHNLPSMEESWILTLMMYGISWIALKVLSQMYSTFCCCICLLIDKS